MAAVFTDSNFDTEVLKADKLSVIDFWAPWCGPCLALGPTIDALSKEYDGKVNVGKVNVDENPNLSINYGVRKIFRLAHYRLKLRVHFTNCVFNYCWM